MEVNVDIARSAKYLKCLSSMLNLSEPDEFTLVKMVYLIQEWGLNLGFRFGWFIYNPLRFEGPFTIGPYSTQLLYYLDEIMARFNEIKVPCENLNEDEIYRLKSISGLIKYFMEKKKGRTSSLQYVLELLSSIHFAFKYVDMPGSEEERIERVIEIKQELTKSDSFEALKLLRKIGVL